MNKNKLITFILNDISELDMLTKCMESMETIPYAMHDLALQKVRNILSEFEQLSVESKEEAQKNSDVNVPSFESETKKTPETCESKVVENVSSEPIVEKETIAKKVEVVEKIEEVKKEEPKKEKIEDKEIEKVEVVEKVKVVENTPAQEANEKESLVSQVKSTTIDVAPAAVDSLKVVAKEPEPKSNLVITNERFKGSRRLENRFVTDLKKALNINDRIRYQRELFGGNMALLNSTIEKLNAMSSLQEAEAYVAENFNWDTTEGAAFEFMELLEARFTN